MVSPKFSITFSHFSFLIHIFLLNYNIMSLLVLFFLIIILNQNKQLDSVSATEFVYNRNFNSTNINLYGNATIQNSILTLTNQTVFTIGRAFYPHSIPMKKPNFSTTLLPFATSFIFSISPCKNLPIGHGFAFIFSPSKVINGALSGNYLGLFNRSSSGNSSNHVLAIEFDDFRNEEFNEENDNHVGVDVNSMISYYSEPAEFWNGETFENLRLASGENYQVWIEFKDSEINVTMAPAGRRKPQRPLISKPIELSSLLLDEMYVGFSGATGGTMVDISRVLAWSFSHSNFSIGDALNTKHLPMYLKPKKSIYRSNGFILGIIFGSFFVIGCCALVYFILLRPRKQEKEENFEDWELEYWPHRFSYKEICEATSGFSEEKVIGIGTSGKVYKGVLKGVEVAVKRFNFNHDTQHGMREFLAEISSLGRMKHRNLVGFKGWSKRKDGKLMLVYDYMENESLDKRIFPCDEETKLLNWDERIRVLQNVACGILYLHEGWDVEVLHRDIKASNVLLDKYMNARLGDFGLARLQHKEQVDDTTRVIGTLGYMAPELIKLGRPSSKSDVYSFGILVLEVVCGRRPIEVNKPPLVDFVTSLMEKDELCCAIDEQLKGLRGYRNEEANRLLHLGLLCASLEPCVRPTIGQVVKALEGIKCNECNVEECIFHEGLIGKLNSTASWSRKSSTNSTHLNFPTLDEIHPSKFFPSPYLSVSYPSLLQPESDSVSEGR